MKDKVFFSGLNELRALAAIAVLFHHIELYKNWLKAPSLLDSSYFSYFIGNLGKNGVYLFFVLSGFLITYLLLEEKSVTGKISVKQFYARRILRIWPLYFIILIVGFLFLPFIYNAFPDFFAGQTTWNDKIEHLVYGKNLLLFLFFFSNIALNIFGMVAGASQSWSVSVEEQFYLIWPWIVKFFHKNLLVVLLAIIIVANVLHHYVGYFAPYPLIKAFITTFNIDFMAMGGILAVIYRKNKVLTHRVTTNKIFVLVVISSVLVHLFFKISDVTTSLSFGLLILIVIENNVRIKMLSHLGKWSYGIYMYHPLVMYLSFSLLTQLGITSGIESILAQYILIFGGTVAISYLSYRYVELFFLKVKHKFSPIVSGTI